MALLFRSNPITPITAVDGSEGVSVAVLWTAVAVLILALTAELLRFSWSGFNNLLLRYFGVLFKGTEAHNVTGATYLLLATVGAFLFFDREVAVAALLFLSLGDPIAGLVGSKLGRHRIGDRSVEGSAAFLLTTLAVAAVLLPAVHMAPYWVLAVGGLTAALTEVLPLPLDDNLIIPLTGGAVMTALG